ncbi:putative Thioesterase [Magnetospirillum sp. XM-1]|uniref:acyl-CoA thioesterase n=1 Tax=Magnetospirillum sp. XM-1 TaxID=1663591 RepID=UPI00073E098E|nr:acyl-CoA thioesterase [Magnetospirillum sp. XM-1]CUW39333.1 putative Thioesterase [Magnetospirillum sp. XM-1]
MGIYTVKRQVSWGDCDPAGILYTPRVFDYCTQTIEGWYTEVVKVDWMTMIRNKQGSPTVHASCDYLKPMEPGLEVAVTLRIDKLGDTSMTFRLEGEDEGGAIYFRAKYVSCVIDFTRNQAMEIPADWRSKIQAYMSKCAAQGDCPHPI